jgi:hypothetical protein
MIASAVAVSTALSSAADDGGWFGRQLRAIPPAIRVAARIGQSVHPRRTYPMLTGAGLVTVGDDRDVV